MWGSPCLIFYKCLPVLHGVTAFIECIFGIVRIIYFFSPNYRSSGSYFSNSNPNDTYPKIYQSTYVAAFTLDWLSSITPTLMGLFVIVTILGLLLRVSIIIISNWCGVYTQTSGVVGGLVKNKALRRFLILDCNCPCYKSRPKRRFQVRVGFLFICFTLRIIAIALYAISSLPGDDDHVILAVICALSLIFLFNSLWFDFYRYTVWWHYTPAGDTRYHCRSRKHERYLPYHMVGGNGDAPILGSRPCRDKPCHKRTLDHIVVFHANNYEPQARWQDVLKTSEITESEIKNKKYPCLKCRRKQHQPHYIGFHATTPEAAVAIAHSEFQPSKNGWLGAGAYFARSVEGTLNKARGGKGAWIIAEIHMGKVYEIEPKYIAKGNALFNTDLYDYVHHSKWHADYDTCYMIHSDDRLDEFAIKDPVKQIIKWVIVIEEDFDNKVEILGLDEEFDTTQCRCI